MENRSPSRNNNEIGARNGWTISRSGNGRRGAAGPDQRIIHGSRGQCAERASGKRRETGRNSVHAKGLTHYLPCALPRICSGRS